jgi:hypothetical protein
VSPPTLPPVRTLLRVAAPSRHAASQSVAALGEPRLRFPCPTPPLFPRELSPLDLPHLATRLDAAGHASPPPRAWPPRGDHGQCAHCVVPEPARLSLLLGRAAGHQAIAHRPASPARRKPWASLKPGTVRLFLIVFQLI